MYFKERLGNGGLGQLTRCHRKLEGGGNEDINPAILRVWPALFPQHRGSGDD